jgi:methyl-accepting chemotaxis protein
MIFSKLKISTKLIISSAVFLIPVGVMLFFIISGTNTAIEKSRNEQYGIKCLRPAVLLFQKVPQYLRLYLGFEEGNLSQAGDQITGALNTLETALKRYEVSDSGGLRGDGYLRTQWEALRNRPKDDPELLDTYDAFMQDLQSAFTWIGEQSSLILVSDMGSYYYIDTALKALPDTTERLFAMGNILRQGQINAVSLIEDWNTALAAAQAQGSRMAQSPYREPPEKISLMMLPMEDRLTFSNSRPLIISGQENIITNLNGLIEAAGEGEKLQVLKAGLEEYITARGIFSDRFSRAMGFNNSNIASVMDIMDGIAAVNNSGSHLWTILLDELDLRIKDNIAAAQRRLAGYLIVALVAVFLAFGVVILSTLDINRSVKRLNTLFKGLEENDLTLTLEVKSADEFGDLMKAFNGFLDILRSTFGAFKQSAQMVATSVFDLSSSAKEITTTANEHSASVSEIVSTMESSTNLSEQIAAKTVEVADLAAQTQDLSQKGAELRTANQSMMEDIREQNLKIISEIKNLTDMIGRINEAIRIIDGIADQTKLIAFNASLEASSSGESGARFAVVASEIRRFADNVVESTKEIKQRIEEVQSASQILITEANNGSKQIDLGYERMSEQKTVFEHIVDNSQNVATRSQQISNLSKQQEYASSQIFTALKEISAGVKQFVIATSSTSKIADNLNGMSGELKETVNKYRTTG